MEQFYYTYLNRRYGLRRLIIEQSAAIAASINRYKAAENDVFLFAKILKNLVDEQFWYVFKSVKS